MGKRVARGYSSEDFEVLFSRPTDVNIEARAGIIAYRTIKIAHGPMMDVIVCPIWSKRSTKETAERIKRESTKAQRLLNHRNSQERVVRIANCNFGEGDALLTCTYGAGQGEDSDARALKTVQSFIKKLSRAWKKKGKELKYIYTIEKTESHANGRRYHLHILLNAAGLDRDWIESLWKHGACNTRRYQYQEEHFGGLAGYMKIYKDNQTKATKRAWVASRNLKKPMKTTSDHKFSVARMEKMARAMEMDARYIVEKAYPGMRCVKDVICRRSEFVPGVYMYARMRRQDAEDLVRRVRD